MNTLRLFSNGQLDLASYPGLCFFFFLSADSRINIMENEREEEEKEEKTKEKAGPGMGSSAK